MNAYPPQPMASRYPPGMVDQVRQQRITAVRRRAFISIVLQVIFIAIFAALLGYYINRNNNDDYYRNDNWFKWYIGLLIALLALDVLILVYVIWRYQRAISWLKNPRTTDEQIMLGYNVEGEGGVVIMHQMPAYQQGYQQYYQPPPNAYAAPPPNSQYPPAYGNQQQSSYLYGAHGENPDTKR